jgi:hypothetical protein
MFCPRSMWTKKWSVCVCGTRVASRSISSLRARLEASKAEQFIDAHIVDPNCVLRELGPYM